jgi:hypothetical protein
VPEKFKYEVTVDQLAKHNEMFLHGIAMSLADKDCEVVPLSFGYSPESGPGSKI